MTEDYYLVEPQPTDPNKRANADAWWKSVMERKQSNPSLIVIPTRIHTSDLVAHAFIDISEFLEQLDELWIDNE